MVTKQVKMYKNRLISCYSLRIPGKTFAKEHIKKWWFFKTVPPYSGTDYSTLHWKKMALLFTEIWWVLSWTSVTELCGPEKGKLALTMSFFFISKAYQSLRYDVCFSYFRLVSKQETQFCSCHLLWGIWKIIDPLIVL